MSSLGFDDGMTTVHGSSTDPVVLVVDNAGSLPTDQYEALESAGFVNWRLVEIGNPAILILAFNR